MTTNPAITADRAALREALEAIRDMEPEPVDESLPDHSDCAECKRIQSTPYHPSTCCDTLYRAIMLRDRRWDEARQRQQGRMRDIAHRALAATPAPEAPTGHTADVLRGASGTKRPEIAAGPVAVAGPQNPISRGMAYDALARHGLRLAAQPKENDRG